MEDNISQWKRKNDQYLQSIKAKIQALKKHQVPSTYCYFTYSIHFSYDPAQESMLIGSFHIYNHQMEPFRNPYICLKLKEASILRFSGKYVYKDSTMKMRMPGAWERMNEKSDKEEFWLKPIEVNQIEPGNLLSFNNFQMKWSPQENYTESMKGFTYGDGFENGIPSLNQIHVSGTNVREGEG